MNKENLDPGFEFDMPKGSKFPVSCRISVPRVNISSSWFATKSAGLEQVEVFRILGHITSSEATMLAESLFECGLPNDNPELDDLIERANDAVIRLIQLSSVVSDHDRGITDGERWKMRTDDE